MRLGIINPRKGHLETFPFPIGSRDRVRAMNPTISVQHVLGQILAMDAIDRITDVLSSGDDQGKRDQKDHGQTVMQPENGSVDVHMGDLDQALQTPEYVQHLGSGKKSGQKGIDGSPTTPRSSVDPLDPPRLSHVSFSVSRSSLPLLDFFDLSLSRPARILPGRNDDFKDILAKESFEVNGETSTSGFFEKFLILRGFFKYRQRRILRSGRILCRHRGIPGHSSSSSSSSRFRASWRLKYSRKRTSEWRTREHFRRDHSCFKRDLTNSLFD